MSGGVTNACSICTMYGSPDEKEKYTKEEEEG